MRLSALFTVVVTALIVVAAAPAHSPVTAIGRAVIGLQVVQVTYDPEATLGPQQADGLLLRVRDTPVRVAVMPAYALEEIGGGPDAVAAEIAREAELDGTLVVVAGTELGAWSDSVDADELGAILADARATADGKELAVAADDLVAQVVAATPPPDEGFPWMWIALVGSVVVAIVLVLWLRRVDHAAVTTS